MCKMHFKIEGAYAPMFQNTTPACAWHYYMLAMHYVTPVQWKSCEVWKPLHFSCYVGSVYLWTQTDNMHYLFCTLFMQSQQSLSPLSLCSMGQPSMHSSMNRTNKLSRFCCQSYWTDALLCVESVHWAPWFAFASHSTWSYSPLWPERKS
jgi:hypothetical protein